MQYRIFNGQIQYVQHGKRIGAFSWAINLNMRNKVGQVHAVAPGWKNNFIISTFICVSQILCTATCFAVGRETRGHNLGVGRYSDEY